MKSKKSILIIFILGIIGLSGLMPSFAEPSVVHSSIDNMSNKYANNLLRVNLVKTTDGKINLILHTTNSFENQVYPIKKSDFEYIVLLPETYHSITSKPDFTDLIDEIRDIQINLVPYIGIKTNNGYTKIVIQTKKRDVNLIVSNESLELAKVIDRELDSVIDKQTKLSLEKTVDDITPVPLEKSITKKTIKVAKKTKKPTRKVVKTYRKPTRKVAKKVTKKVTSKPVKPKVEPKKVLEVNKTQKAEKKPQEQIALVQKEQVQKSIEVVNQSKRTAVQKQMNIQVKNTRKPVPKKQSPLAGLLGNKWLYLIGIPLLLILLALKNLQKNAVNQTQYDMYQNPEEEYYPEDEEGIEFNDEQEIVETDGKIFGGLKREVRQDSYDELQEEYLQEEQPKELYQEQEEPQEELLYDEEIALEEEPEVEVLTPEVVRQEQEFEEISPDELEEISLDEEIPLEDRVSQEEVEALIEDNQEEFKLDEESELFEDIEVEEEFSLDEQEDLFEDIEVEEELILDPDAVSKAFEEVKEKTLAQEKEAQIAAVAIEEPSLEVVPEPVVVTNPVYESPIPAVENILPTPVIVEPKVQESVQDEFAATMTMQGLNVLDSKRVDVNKGFYLVEMENKKALIGFINNEYDVLCRFKKDVASELRIKKTEEKPKEDIYLVEAKPWKALISVSDNSIKTKLIL